MKTQKIILIRHAEKALPTNKTYGVNNAGDRDDKSLSVAGWQRAGALAALLGNAPAIAAGMPLLRPQYLFAAGMQTADDSKRPAQTLMALADKLGLEIGMRHCKGAETEVAASATACGGVALICWEHKRLPLVANALLGSQHASPQVWPDDRYDMAWIFDLDNLDTPDNKQAYRFSQMPQQLLAGDSMSPIAM